MASGMIVGCGTLGTVVAELRATVGERALCFSRDPRGLPPGAIAVPGDVMRPECFDAITEPLDWIVYAVGPSSRDPQAYRDVYETGLQHLLDWLDRRGNDLTRLLLVSSTAVYAQSDGQWIDENSPTEPEAPTAKLLLSGEQRVSSRWPNSVILRLAGIYGPSRQSLLDRALLGLPPRVAGSQIVNRMHVLDCARAVEHLVAMAHPQQVYIGADDEPASQQAVLDWLRTRFQLPPGEVTAALGEVSFSHKRCRNTRLKEAGFSLLYPTFRDGYTALARAAGLTPR